MDNREIREKARQNLGSNIFSSQWMTALAACLIYSVIVGALAAIPGVGSIASLLLAGPLAFGLVLYFVKLARSENPTVENLFDGFKDFSGTFTVHFMVSLFTFLWTLLFIIPGIVKSYSYSMALYIKNDHPEYGWQQCIDESRCLMDGHKAELFCLHLSFLGWALLCLLTAGIGFLWLSPYMEASNANFYQALVGDCSFDNSEEQPYHDSEAVYEAENTFVSDDK